MPTLRGGVYSAPLFCEFRLHLRRQAVDRAEPALAVALRRFGVLQGVGQGEGGAFAFLGDLHQIFTLRPLLAVGVEPGPAAAERVGRVKLQICAADAGLGARPALLLPTPTPPDPRR